MNKAAAHRKKTDSFSCRDIVLAVVLFAMAEPKDCNIINPQVKRKDSAAVIRLIHFNFRKYVKGKYKTKLINTKKTQKTAKSDGYGRPFL